MMDMIIPNRKLIINNSGLLLCIKIKISGRQPMTEAKKSTPTRTQRAIMSPRKANMMP